jgi:hypothetical protein
MQPEQNQSSSSLPTTPTPTSPEPNQKRAMPKWVWFIIGGAVLLIGGFIYLAVMLLNLSAPSQNGTMSSQKLTKLTVGSQEYIYPCSVATEADYAQIFKLDDQTVGTVSETSALPAGEIEANTSDLTKLAPATRDRYKTSCSYTLAKTGANRMNTVDVNLEQYAAEKEAQANFKSQRKGASGDYTDDGVDNGTHQMTTLPSFPENSYVRLPDADSVFPGLKATFISDTRLVTLEYNFGPNENTATILPLLDQYAKAIQSKINLYKEGKPVDLTGRTTFVGKKFVGLCYQTDLSKLVSAFGDIHFRPDEATTTSVYGSLSGSRAATDGAESDCKLGYNTAGDRSAQDTRKSSSRLYADKIWPHDLTISVNTLHDADEAKAYLAAKKADAAKPSAFGGTPTIENVVGVGEGAYRVHKEFSQNSLFSGQQNQILHIEDTLAVVSGSDVIVVSLNQVSEGSPYKTVPLQVTEAQQKKAYAIIRETLEQHR